ncbi:alpha/beta hydrolase [Candidatus Calescamantes bacterium]|nr:alpha/beta hydrolase [Candidatus Calescamantes bacterium]
MRKENSIIAACVILLSAMLLFSCTKNIKTDEADISGTQWIGTLTVGVVEMRLRFNFTPDKEGKLTGTMDSSDQGVEGIPFSDVLFDGKKLAVSVDSVQGTYRGALSETKDMFKGTWSQGGQEFALDLKRETEKLELVRPQEPKPPFPYTTEDIIFTSPFEEGNTIGATITIPEGKGPFPAVVLISGSGQQDRDCFIMGHRPFLVIADHLARNKIASIRYDDRAVGESIGQLESVTSENFADDALAALQKLKKHGKTDPKKLGMIGHSEGGMIAPIAFSKAPVDISFMVLLAGPGTRGDVLLVKQSAMILEAMGQPEEVIAQALKMNRQIYDTVIKYKDDLTRKLKVATIFAGEEITSEEQIAEKIPPAMIAKIKIVTSPWFVYFLNYDPAPFLKKISVPVLALNGDKDLQVYWKDNLEGIEKTLKASGNKDVEIRMFPTLNHLFQHSETGVISEYGQIEETFAPEALTMISEWINSK